MSFVIDKAPTIEGTEGIDIITNGFQVYSDGRIGFDSLSGDDVIDAKGGNDFILDVLGDNCIIGGEGNDQIITGAGDDIILGGAGSDNIIGGAGSDLFAFNAADFADGEVDRIADFQTGQDKIVIAGLGEGDEVAFDGVNLTVNGNPIATIAGIDPLNPPEITQDDEGRYEIM